ncbi:hypothetical protein [Microbacterium aurantiacum]|uniref:hypothetical protein n=1 Tax=Microbacterium aurantiacum TaxID=162393 RepID=UPI001F38D5F5|nr:hypothetical protein [Microbacterium aurantiacum]
MDTPSQNTPLAGPPADQDIPSLLEDEIGDVPGWVLITLMTAGLVVLIWALAGPALAGLFESAIARVSGL